MKRKLLCVLLSVCMVLTCMPVVAITAFAADTISYLDADGSTKTIASADVTVLNNPSDDGNVLESGWYLLSGSYWYRGTKLAEGADVKFILEDKCEYNFYGIKDYANAAGILVPTGTTLTIYAQSTGSDMGVLNACSYYRSAGSSGIGGIYYNVSYNDTSAYLNTGCGKVVINGGNICARSDSSSGSGIGGEGAEIEINGGEVYAKGDYAGLYEYGNGVSSIIDNCYSGIGGRHFKSITINGGVVAAIGQGCPAIGTDNDYDETASITINGGTVRAVTDGAYSNVAAIGAGASSTAYNIAINGGYVFAEINPEVGYTMSNPGPAIGSGSASANTAVNVTVTPSLCIKTQATEGEAMTTVAAGRSADTDIASSLNASYIQCYKDTAHSAEVDGNTVYFRPAAVAGDVSKYTYFTGDLPFFTVIKDSYDKLTCSDDGCIIDLAGAIVDANIYCNSTWSEKGVKIISSVKDTVHKYTVGENGLYVFDDTLTFGYKTITGAVMTGTISAYNYYFDISDVTFAGNSTGSAIEDDGSYFNTASTVTDCTFIGNALKDSSLIHSSDNNIIKLTDCVIKDNTVTADGMSTYASVINLYYGGKAVITDTEITGNNCIISEDKADEAKQYSAIVIDGGTYGVELAGSTVIENNTVTVAGSEPENANVCLDYRKSQLTVDDDFTGTFSVSVSEDLKIYGDIDLFSGDADKLEKVKLDDENASFFLSLNEEDSTASVRVNWITVTFTKQPAADDFTVKAEANNGADVSYQWYTMDSKNVDGTMVNPEIYGDNYSVYEDGKWSNVYVEEDGETVLCPYFMGVISLKAGETVTISAKFENGTQCVIYYLDSGFEYLTQAMNNSDSVSLSYLAEEDGDYAFQVIGMNDDGYLPVTITEFTVSTYAAVDGQNTATLTTDAAGTYVCKATASGVSAYSDTVTIEKAVHTHTPVTIPGKAATCTEDGLTDGVKCSECGEILTAQEVIPAKGHTEVTVPGKDATCTETGLTDGVKCSVCNEVLTAQEVIPAKGHTEVTVPGTAATCTEAGVTDKVYCSVCNTVISEATEIPAKGHTWSSWTVETEATEDTKGVRSRTCSVCGEKETEEFEYSGELSRKIKFVNISKMHYIVDYVNGWYAVYNSSTLKWYENKPLKFKVRNYSDSGHDTLYVYMNDYVELTPDEDGWYTIPAGTDFTLITVSGSRVVDEPETEESGSSTGTDTCGHICHTNNSLLKLLWKVICWFCKIAKVNQTCSCGVAHY